MLRYGAMQPTMRADHGNIALAIRALGLVLPRPGWRPPTRIARCGRQHAIRLQGAERAAVPLTELAMSGRNPVVYDAVMAP